MNESIWGLLVLVTLVVFLLGATGFGEATDKPLWLAGVVPAVVSGAILFTIVGVITPFNQWGQPMMIVGGYLVMGPAVLGVITYLTASRARNARTPTYRKDEFR